MQEFDMDTGRARKMAAVLAAVLFAGACGTGGVPPGDAPPGGVINAPSANVETYARSSIWDVFGPDRSEQVVQVNRYIWAASLDVLSFLPVESADPFTGLIVTGYGTPPGGGRTYRATVHVSDPALEARSLSVALQSRNGPVSPATARAVEDAILSRARQLRIADNRL
jgi:hypothetical protein